ERVAPGDAREAEHPAEDDRCCDAHDELDDARRGRHESAPHALKRTAEREEDAERPVERTVDDEELVGESDDLLLAVADERPDDRCASGDEDAGEDDRDADRHESALADALADAVGEPGPVV